jgi:hypothetical protein
MRKPRRLTISQASTACYRDSFTVFLTYAKKTLNSGNIAPPYLTSVLVGGEYYWYGKIKVMLKGNKMYRAMVALNDLTCITDLAKIS